MRSTRLLHMQEGRAHVFTRANPWREGNAWGLPQYTEGDYIPAYGVSVPWNPWIGQSFRTALFWAKSGWPIRRYGWKDREIVWDDGLKENGQPWIPSEDDQFVEDWMIGGNAEVGSGDPGVDPFLTLYVEVGEKMVTVWATVNKGDYPTVDITIGDQLTTVPMGQRVTRTGIVGKFHIVASSKDLREERDVDIPYFPVPSTPYWVNGEGVLRASTHLAQLIGSPDTGFISFVRPDIAKSKYKTHPSSVQSISPMLKEIWQPSGVPFAIVQDVTDDAFGVTLPLGVTSVNEPPFPFKSVTIRLENKVFERPLGRWAVSRSSEAGAIGGYENNLGYDFMDLRPKAEGSVFKDFRNGDLLHWQLEFHV